MHALTYAIDYGTTNSLLTAASAKKVYEPVIFRTPGGESTTLKSIIFVDKQFNWSFGKKAIDLYLDDPTSGRLFKSIKKFLPDSSFEETKVFSKKFFLHDIISKQLAFMKKTADVHYQYECDSVILGHPARYASSDVKHQLALERLRASAQSAGFKNIQFCPEPVAAAYKFQHTLSSEKIVLMVDLGGGTSDFTVLKMSQHPLRPSDVISLGGIPIAGDALDGALMKLKFTREFGLDASYRLPMGQNLLNLPITFLKKLYSPADLALLSSHQYIKLLEDVARYAVDSENPQKIKTFIYLLEERLGYSFYREIEKAKICLSQSSLAHFSFLYPGISIEAQINHEDFHLAISEPVNQILDCLDKTISDGGLSDNQIDIVCLTGGTTEIPYLKEKLLARFGAKLKESDKFSSVVAGLASKAQQAY